MAGHLARLGAHPPGERMLVHQLGPPGWAGIWRLTIKHEVPPASVRNLQEAIIPGTLLNGAGLTRNGSESMGGGVPAGD